jgi:hypothetical protein
MRHLGDADHGFERRHRRVALVSHITRACSRSPTSDVIVPPSRCAPHHKERRGDLGQVGSVVQQAVRLIGVGLGATGGRADDWTRWVSRVSRPIRHRRAGRPAGDHWPACAAIVAHDGCFGSAVMVLAVAIAILATGAVLVTQCLGPVTDASHALR